ncbi:hypothetical protein FB451DRAFT_1366669 [Mycena latifolia]|nr:hypothetical protein FB451DRAFT_1366669 [Mycena latifolia]
MFSPKAILTALAFVAVSSATPVAPTPDTSVTITVCTAGDGCNPLPVVSGQCVNFIGGSSFLNKAITYAVVPNGLACTFFESFGCDSVSATDSVGLTGGSWNMYYVRGRNFADQTSSISCSPIF